MAIEGSGEAKESLESPTGEERARADTYVLQHLVPTILPQHNSETGWSKLADRGNNTKWKKVESPKSRLDMKQVGWLPHELSSHSTGGLSRSVL